MSNKSFLFKFFAFCSSCFGAIAVVFSIWALVLGISLFSPKQLFFPSPRIGIFILNPFFHFHKTDCNKNYAPFISDKALASLWRDQEKLSSRTPDTALLERAHNERPALKKDIIKKVSADYWQKLILFILEFGILFLVGYVILRLVAGDLTQSTHFSSMIHTVLRKGVALVLLCVFGIKLAFLAKNLTENYLFPRLFAQKSSYVMHTNFRHDFTAKRCQTMIDHMRVLDRAIDMFLLRTPDQQAQSQHKIQKEIDQTLNKIENFIQEKEFQDQLKVSFLEEMKRDAGLIAKKMQGNDFIKYSQGTVSRLIALLDQTMKDFQTSLYTREELEKIVAAHCQKVVERLQIMDLIFMGVVIFFLWQRKKMVSAEKLSA